MFTTALTERKIAADLLYAGLEDDSCGGIVVFEGRVRRHHESKEVSRLFYECYRPMAEKTLQNLARRAAEEWKAKRIHLSHRIGDIPIGDIAVWIGVAAEHRAEAFAACRFLIEAVKSQVPIWKHETYADGRSEWIACQHR